MINTWLNSFKSAWENHDIDAVMALFADDVEYWETPFRKITSKQSLETEWQVIRTQQDISLATHVYVMDDSRCTVQWDLRYKNDADTEKRWAGT